MSDCTFCHKSLDLGKTNGQEHNTCVKELDRQPTTTYALAVDKILLVNIVLDANRVKHQLQIIKIILVLKRNEINYFFLFFIPFTQIRVHILLERTQLDRRPLLDRRPRRYEKMHQVRDCTFV